MHSSLQTITNSVTAVVMLLQILKMRLEYQFEDAEVPEGKLQSLLE